MRTIKTTLYKYEELSKESKLEARVELSDINTDYDWWDFIYEDAANILLKITSFDLERNEIELLPIHGHTVQHVADMILEKHGKTCNTHHLAENLANMSYGEFLKALRIEYLKMLQQEYQYRTSTEAIEDTIIANEYEFLESGKFYYEKLFK